MAKKDFKGGLDLLLTPTLNPPKQADDVKPVQPLSTSNLPVSSAALPKTSSGALSKVLINLPADIKMKLDLYCVHNRITKQDFISNLIINSLAVH